MPILLTTPHTFSPGRNAPDETSNEVRISMFSMELDNQHILIRIRYGNTVAGVWTAGRAPPVDITYEEHPMQTDGEEEIVPAVTDYSELVFNATTSAAGLSLYTEVKNSLYQKLIDEGDFPGVIV